jgi:hypothetical protein
MWSQSVLLLTVTQHRKVRQGSTIPRLHTCCDTPIILAISAVYFLAATFSLFGVSSKSIEASKLTAAKSASPGHKSCTGSMQVTRLSNYHSKGIVILCCFSGDGAGTVVSVWSFLFADSLFLRSGAAFRWVEKYELAVGCILINLN